MAKQTESKFINTIEIRQGRADYWLLGTTPHIPHAFSESTGKELLFPAKKKSKAEKETTLKHKPLEEYRGCFYKRRPDDKGPTRLLMPSRLIKAAISEVAKRMPGASASEVRQLVFVEGIYNDLYGVPEILMSYVRNLDILRTPDIRTRPIMPLWACKVTIRHVLPHISADVLHNLVSAAGVLCGLGDGRPQKGNDVFGQYETVSANDARLRAVMKMGIKQQDAAIARPNPFDQFSADMLGYHNAESRRRNFKLVA